MIIHALRRTVILSPKEAAGVLQQIPHAKAMNYRGLDLLTVNHGLDETRVLRNLGVKVRSPILDYYTWPRNKASIPFPFEVQKKTAAFLTLNSRAFCLNGLGSGKTLASLWAFDYLRSLGQAKRLLVISTLSTMDSAWRSSVEAHLPHLNCVVLYGTSKKRKALLDVPADVYIINHDGVGVIQDCLRAREDIDVVVIDEVSDAARNARTNRWRALDTVINAAGYKEDGSGTIRRSKLAYKPKRWVWGLTGTPTPNRPTDAYAQSRLLVPEQAPRSFTAFQDMTMRQVSTFQWVPKHDAMDHVYKILHPSIRFSLEECIDLPPTTHIDRYVALTKPQQKAYDAMKQTLIAEVEAGTIVAANEGVKASKLIQIACGFGYSEGGGTVHFDAKPRLEETLALIRQSQSKAIVFVPFVEAVSIVAAFLRDAGVSVAVVYGDVPKRDRDRIFRDFQQEKDPHVIVCQPEVMAHGLTLTAASMSIWYAPYFKAGIYEQANGRTPRPGQKLHTIIAHVGGTPIEKRMYERLKSKTSMQGILLDMIRDARET